MSPQQREPSPDLLASPVTPVNVSTSITNANSAATSSASGVPQAVSEPSVNGSQPLSPGRKRRKVTRSRLGCLTCRKRRKLCDMTKPICQACTRLKIASSDIVIMGRAGVTDVIMDRNVVGRQKLLPSLLDRLRKGNLKRPLSANPLPYRLQTSTT